MTQPDHLLIVDDDHEIRDLVAACLRREGFTVSAAADGVQLRAVLEREKVDLVILDLMLPGEDGMALCRALRSGALQAHAQALPILMLTARADETDRVAGLELGADDYLTKPFAARELVARVRAVLRRTRMLPPAMQQVAPPNRIRFGDWMLDTSARHLLDAHGTMVSLSGAEYRLLRVFLDHPQRVLNRDQLLNLTHGHAADQFDRSIDLLVSRVRQRLAEDAREPRYIKTVRSEGYLFAASVGHGPSQP